MDMFEQRLNEFNDSFEESVDDEDISLEEFLRYEMIFSFEKSIFETEEKLKGLGLL